MLFAEAPICNLRVPTFPDSEVPTTLHYQCSERLQGLICRRLIRLADYPWLTWMSFIHYRATCAQGGTSIAGYCSQVPLLQRHIPFPPQRNQGNASSSTCFFVVHRRLILWLSWRRLLPTASVSKANCSQVRQLVCAGAGHWRPTSGSPSLSSAPGTRTRGFGGLPHLSGRAKQAAL